MPTRTKLGVVDSLSKFEGRLKVDWGTEQGPLKPPPLRHGAARAAGARRSESRDKATMTNCTQAGNQKKMGGGGSRKDSRQGVKVYLLELNEACIAAL